MVNYAVVAPGYIGFFVHFSEAFAMADWSGGQVFNLWGLRHAKRMKQLTLWAIDYDYVKVLA